jgi:hypothetical protein
MTGLPPKRLAAIWAAPFASLGDLGAEQTNATAGTFGWDVAAGVKPPRTSCPRAQMNCLAQLGGTRHFKIARLRELGQSVFRPET